MFSSKLMLTVIVVAAAIGPQAAAAHATAPTDRGELRLGATTFITDTLAPGGSSASVQGYRFVTDTLAPGGPAPKGSYRFVTDTLAPGGGASGVVYSPAANTFDWADAGIGAAAAAGLALLLLAGRRALVRRRSVVTV